MFEPEHMDITSNPTRRVCYHGSAVYALYHPETGESRMGLRIFGHQPVNEGDEIDPTSDVTEIFLTPEEALEIMTGLLAGYEGMTGPLSMYGGSPN